MQIEKMDIIKLFRQYCLLRIPFFQRDYVWEKNEIKKLLSDVLACDNNIYYVGTIVIKTNGDWKSVIDGQQRLSSFWLIIKALEFYLKNKKQNFN